MRIILLITIFSVLSVSAIQAQRGDVSTNNPILDGIDNDYQILPVPFTSIVLADSFWLPRINRVHEVTIPHSLAFSADKIMNFKIAAKLEEGPFQSYFTFDDTDVYKTIEAISYSLYYNPDADMETEVDSIISIIALAQEPDGYLYTCRTIGEYLPGFPAGWLGDNRWDLVQDLSHELYNLGHLFEAACAYYNATGKDKLLTVAIKAADLIDQDFGWGKLEKYPGHQIVELGLVRLYRVTGDSRYLDLAKFFLDVRGPGGPEYCQASLSVADQTKAVGHSVRAVYMYEGMADVAALTNNNSYLSAIDKIWEDLITGKTYVTGGIGSASYNEGFTEDYDLPNRTAYCENCSSIGNIYFNHRLFLHHGEAKYIDMLERTLYNNFLAGISLSGDKFFYPNRLHANHSVNRTDWFTCACCPPNIAKTIPAVPDFIYAKKADTLYVNLFISDTATFSLDGDNIKVIQTTDYPWQGDVNIELQPEIAREFTLMVRIPGWARNEAIYGNIYQFLNDSDTNASIKLNGEDLPFDIVDGYAIIKRAWAEDDKLLLNLPMEPRKLIAHELIEEDKNKFAIQRGPIVFCAEEIDNEGNINNIRYEKESVLSSYFEPSVMNGIQLVTISSVQVDGSPGNDVTLIPYSYWNNRGPSDMYVWMSEYQEISFPDSLILVLMEDFATTNHVSDWETLYSIYDLYEPESSSDKGLGAFGNWRFDGETVNSWNWVQYNFEESKTISSSKVYWWRDGAGINIPDSSYLSYYNEALDRFIKIESSLKEGTDIYADRYNKEIFEAINTKKIRLNFYGSSFAQGILEWKVYSPGTETYLPKMPEPEIAIKIYPNPATNNITIDLGYPEKAEIEIYDLIGNLVYKNVFSSTIIINRSDISYRGMYIAKILVNGHIQSRRIVFQ